MKTKISKDLREFIGLLISHKVDFVLVGGHAVAFHGWPRFTGDIDFFVRPTSENAERVLEVVRAFGFATPDLSAELFTQPKRNVQLGRPPNRIDILTWISGLSFDEAWASHDTAMLDGLALPILGRDALILNKRASGRAKDLADLEQLDAGSQK
jgi:hypothetical protein